MRLVLKRDTMMWLMMVTFNIWIKCYYSWVFFLLLLSNVEISIVLAIILHQLRSSIKEP